MKIVAILLIVIQFYQVFNTDCPAGMYGSGPPYCANCHPQCVNCLTSTVGCIQCSTTYRVYSPTCYLTGNCPAATYETSTACIDCDTNCGQCTSTLCQTCKPGFLFHNGDKKCYSSTNCPAATYETSTACIDCDTNCGQCTSTLCQTCKPGFLSHSGDTKCYSTTNCPPATYETSTACIDCDTNCGQCTSTLCQTCKPGFLFYSGDTKCYSTTNCPAATYETSTACIDCDPTCQQCTSTACQVCKPGLLSHIGDPKCYSSTNCPPATYETSTACIDCTPGCAKCASSSCQACKPGYLLYLGDYQCYQEDSCPSGTYASDPYCLDTSNKILQMINNFKSALTSSAGYSSLLNFSNPGLFCLFAFVDLFEYIRYININFPSKLQIFLDDQTLNQDIFGFIPEIPEQVSDKFQRDPSPDRFGYYEVPASFIVYLWESLISLLISILILVVILLVEFCVRENQIMLHLCQKVKLALKWNFIFSLFISNYGDIALSTSLEIRSLDLDSGFGVLSFIVCLLFNLLALLVFLKMLSVVIQLSKSLTQKTTFALAKTKLKNYEFLFETYKTNSLWHMIFAPFTAIYSYICAIVIGCLSDSPLVQTSILTTLNLLLLLYVVLGRPFESKIEFMGFATQQIFMLCANICVLILAIYDEKSVNNDDARELIGDILIYTSIILNAIVIFYAFLNFLPTLKIIFLFIKSKCVQKETDKTAQSEQKTLDQEMSNPDLSKSVGNTLESSMQPCISEPTLDQLEAQLRNRTNIFKRSKKGATNMKEKNNVNFPRKIKKPIRPEPVYKQRTQQYVPHNPFNTFKSHKKERKQKDYDQETFENVLRQAGSSMPANFGGYSYGAIDR